MRHVLLLLVVALCDVSPRPGRVEGDRERRRQGRRGVERFQAAEKVDLDRLGKLLADDLTYTHST